jgi:putative heme-binding domain-containing protein
VESGRIPREDLSAFTARQLRNLGDARVTERVRTLWGKVRATPADKVRKIASLKKRLTPESLARADRSAGRVVFKKTCASCHKLFGEGGAIGPDITGSQRRNLDYILENLIDPSATVSKDFQMQVFQTTAGRVITGLVVAESKAAVTVQTVNDKVIIPNDEIEARKTSNVSMMPEGMLEKLSRDEVRDLIGYLAGTSQAPLERQSK